MSFTSRKLYPTPKALVPNCCEVVCGCNIPSVGSPTYWQPPGAAVSDQFCYCVIMSSNDPIQECPEEGDCPRCAVVDITSSCNGNWWGSGCDDPQIYVCAGNTRVPCICSGGSTWRPPPVCISPTEDPCCPAAVWFNCYPIPIEYDLGNGGVTPLLENCELKGTVPFTYKIENPNFTPFTCGLSSSPEYYMFFLEDDGDIGATGAIGDPDLSRNHIAVSGLPITRYYKLPSASETPTVISATHDFEFSRYCFKMHQTLSQEAGSGNRAMVVSGRNVYRYTGVLSGDPKIPQAEPLWDDPGASGLSQIEGSRGVTFPLLDYYVRLPLWGQEKTDNLGVIGPAGNPCADPYFDCCVTATDSQCKVCAGCDCIRNTTYGTPISKTGHYLPNDIGYTAGYFSFACFNPYAYLDHVEYVTPGLGQTPYTKVHVAGNTNVLGFGSIAADNAYGCEDDGFGNPINCNGFTGATAHGIRLGYPTCSVWAMIKATYARVWKAYKTSAAVLGLGGQWTESNFRTQLPNFTQAVDNALAANPSQTTNGTSNVQYHLAKISEALEKDTDLSSPFDGSALGGVIRFTFPNVFLWDKAAFESASATDKWKHLYIVGNGNILFDSSSAVITSPAYGFTGPSDVRYTDDQDYRSFVFTLDEVTHKKSGTVTSTSPQARLFVFNGSEGPTSGGNIADTTNPAARKNASSKISLTELPVCSGFTATDYDNGNYMLSLCEICNAWPNAVCLTGTTPSCGIVTGLSGTDDLCIYPGGYHIRNFNCMTASYEVPGADNTFSPQYSFANSTAIQPHSPFYVDPEIMLGFEGDNWRTATGPDAGTNPDSLDDPDGSLARPYRERLAAVSVPYTYVQEDVGGYTNGNPLIAPIGRVIGLQESTGLTAFKLFYDRLNQQQRKALMIEIERPWVVLLSAPNDLPKNQLADPNGAINIEDPRYVAKLRDEFTRQFALGVEYLSAGQTPGSPATDIITLKKVSIRLFKDACQYAKDRGTENVVLFNTHGIPSILNTGEGLIPPAGARDEPTADNRSWWRRTPYVPSMQNLFDAALTNGFTIGDNKTRDSLGYLAESCMSADSYSMQLYNYSPNTASSSTVSLWKANNWTERLVHSGGGSAAAASDYNLDDFNYWTKMSYGSSIYEYKARLDDLVSLGYNVNPNKPVAVLATIGNYPSGGYNINNRWGYYKNPVLFGEIDVAGLYADPDENVPNVSYPDQTWIWDAAHFYNVRIPAGIAYGVTIGGVPLPATGSNANDEIEVLASRCQLEKLLFKRPEVQTVAEGGLSSEAQLMADEAAHVSSTRPQQVAWFRANTLPNVYWDSRTQYYDAGNVLQWHSEGVTSNIRFWSAMTGNCLPSPLVFDRTSPLAPWLNFNNDLFKNDIRVALKHWVSERYVTAIESAYRVLQNKGIVS